MVLVWWLLSCVAVAAAVLYVRGLRRYFRIERMMAVWHATPHEERIRVFRELLSRYPRDAAATWLLACAQFRDRRFAEADQSYRAASRLDCRMTSATVLAEVAASAATRPECSAGAADRAIAVPLLNLAWTIERDLPRRAQADKLGQLLLMAMAGTCHYGPAHTAGEMVMRVMGWFDGAGVLPDAFCSYCGFEQCARQLRKCEGCGRKIAGDVEIHVGQR